MSNPPLTPTAAMEAFNRLVRIVGESGSAQWKHDIATVRAALSTLPAGEPVWALFCDDETRGEWFATKDAAERARAENDWAVGMEIAALYRAPADQEEGS